MSSSHTKHPSKRFEASSGRVAGATTSPLSHRTGTVSNSLSTSPSLLALTLPTMATQKMTSPTATSSTSPAIGNTFMVLSSAKAKTRKQAAMVAAGRAALEGVEEEEPKSEAISASAQVPALAPDTREQVRTRLLQQKLKRFQIEAVEGRDERPAKRQRVMEREVVVMDAESKQEDNILNLKDRVEKMEGEIAEEIAGETSNAARWIRKRLLLNLQEKERLLIQFVETKEKERQASEKVSLSQLGQMLAASP